MAAEDLAAKTRPGLSNHALVQPDMAHSLPAGPLAIRHPSQPQFRILVEAMGGPESRPPLVYTGDVHESLNRLHADVVSSYRAVCSALHEPERHDLINPTAGSSGLSLLPGPSSSLLTSPPALQYNSSTSSTLLPYGRPQQPLSLLTAPAAATASSSRYLGTLPGSSTLTSQRYPSAGAMRASSVSTITQAPIDAGVFVQQESTLYYPPIGSTFEGRASAHTKGHAQIDTLNDLNFRRPRPLNVELDGTDGGGLSRVGQHRLQGHKDELDRFLSDYAQGAADAKSRSLLAHTINAPPSYSAGTLARYAQQPVGAGRGLGML